MSQKEVSRAHLEDPSRSPTAKYLLVLSVIAWDPKDSFMPQDILTLEFRFYPCRKEWETLLKWGNEIHGEFAPKEYSVIKLQSNAMRVHVLPSRCTNWKVLEGVVIKSMIRSTSKISCVEWHLPYHSDTLLRRREFFSLRRSRYCFWVIHNQVFSDDWDWIFWWSCFSWGKFEWPHSQESQDGFRVSAYQPSAVHKCQATMQTDSPLHPDMRHV